MDKPISNKMIKNKKEAQEASTGKNTSKFHFPSQDVTIEAKDQEQALDKLKKLNPKKS